MGNKGELRNNCAAKALWNRLEGAAKGCNGFLDLVTEVNAPGRSSGGGLLDAVTDISSSSCGELGREFAGLVVLCACIVIGLSDVRSVTKISRFM